MAQKYAALIHYDGGPFCGWQRQAENEQSPQPTIQALIEEAIFKVSGERVSVVGSGRTDAGVHAIGQVAHFSLEEKVWESTALRQAINALIGTLSQQITPLQAVQVAKVWAVSDEFHAQRSALRKQYSYYIVQSDVPVPHWAPYSHWVRKPLNLERMNQALALLVGEHDFKAFQASGAKPGSTVRTIFEAEATRQGLPFGDQGPFKIIDQKQDFSLIRLRVTGSGFLKQMVRGIAGTILQVGEGSREPSEISQILSTLDRSALGPTAPARGLWLEKVWYPEAFGL